MLQKKKENKEKKPKHNLEYDAFFSHLFCKAKTVDQLLQLPMTRLEEDSLVQFLTASGDQYCQEILILHYLQRACYVEAIRLNERLKQTVMVNSQDLVMLEIVTPTQ